MSSEREEMQRAVIEPIIRALDSAGIYLAVTLRDGVLFLEGEVDSEENRQAALDVALAAAEPMGLPIEDGIDVMYVESFDSTSDDGLPPDTEPSTIWEPEGDFLDRRTMPQRESMADTIEDVGTIDPEEAGEEAVPYFPPTDPVLHIDARREPDMPGDQTISVLGGFSATSMDDFGDADRDLAELIPRGDEQLADDIRRELAEDALTTDLVVEVLVRNGAVFLRGFVPSIEDAENAEAVAARVPGVDVVEEQLRIQNLQADH